MERLIEAARRHEDQSLRDDVVIVAIERPVPIPWAAPDAPHRPGARRPMRRADANVPDPPGDVTPLGPRVWIAQ